MLFSQKRYNTGPEHQMGTMLTIFYALANNLCAQETRELLVWAKWADPLFSSFFSPSDHKTGWGWGREKDPKMEGEGDQGQYSGMGLYGGEGE